MNMKEASKAAEYECRKCIEERGRCGKHAREKCWRYIAQIALIRAIPAKPAVKGTIDTSTGKLEKLYCPNCDRRLKNDSKNRFCPRCGKAIDWEVTE